MNCLQRRVLPLVLAVTALAAAGPSAHAATATGDPQTWGLLATPEFDRQPMKTVFFFAGNWKGPQSANDAYSLYPADAGDLGFSDSSQNRASTVDRMIAVGTNVITMSYWGPPGTDRWAFWAPMLTSIDAHNQLFDATLGKNIAIMPTIESGASTRPVGGISDAYQFADDFPGSAADPAPQLVAQVEDLVNRYIWICSSERCSTAQDASL